MKTIETNTKQKTVQNRSATAENGSKGISMPAVPVIQNKEEKELLPEAAPQLKSTMQLVGPEDETQLKTTTPFQLKANNTGMPDQLKSGVENLSGMDMSDVKVHYNSSQPSQLQALAYAQGNDIHIGPGQEKHLPHEAWHVVQQRQGRVQATKQMKQGVAVNDDPGLEHEADVMGAKALANNTGKDVAVIQQVKDSTNTIQLLKWKKVANRLQVFNPATGELRDPVSGNDDDNLNEYIDRAPSIGVWRDDYVWEDEEQRFRTLGADNVLSAPQENLLISPITQVDYTEGAGMNFGHRFSFTVHMLGESIRWLETTDRAYAPGMEDNVEMDLYEHFRADSDVFVNARTIRPRYWGYSFSDPPGIIQEPNNHRVLNFNIIFRDTGGNESRITGIQRLATDAEGVITERSLVLNIV